MLEANGLEKTIKMGLHGTLSNPLSNAPELKGVSSTSPTTDAGALWREELPCEAHKPAYRAAATPKELLQS